VKKQFENYLIEQGYSITTPAGNPSTVYDYGKRIEKICEWENTTWNGLAANIGIILPKYEIGGIKETFGSKSHNAVRNALRRFSEYLAAK
jgi:hypothetical protein